ncbi:MAG: hypothetical protein H5T70_12200, partial [Chloroflexi bacterium]|nr:hypothetical protein [Chloroflexota bacterium]
DADIHVLLLPEGLDPDELILQDRARWDRLVAEALPVGEFLFRRVLESADLTTARGKREAVDRLLPIVAAIDNPVERTHYLQRLAQAVRMDERQLLPAREQYQTAQGRFCTRWGGAKRGCAGTKHNARCCPGPGTALFGPFDRCAPPVAGGHGGGQPF